MKHYYVYCFKSLHHPSSNPCTSVFLFTSNLQNLKQYLCIVFQGLELPAIKELQVCP
jgi:hypothetical protein